MAFRIEIVIYLIVIALAIIACIINLKSLDKAAIILFILLPITFFSEIVAYYSALKYKNNLWVYHFFNPVQFFVISLYYNYSIVRFRKKHIGIYIALAGVGLGILNSIYLQNLKSLNSYFLLFEGMSIIFMSLFSFSQMFIDNNIDLLKYSHFWLTFILLSFWSITFVNWGLYEVIQSKALFFMPAVLMTIWIVNVLTYLGMGLVFLYYPKKIKN